MKSLFITTLILTFTLLFISKALHAEKFKLLELKDEVIRQATLELDQAMTSPEGSLFKFAQKFHVIGEYTLQLTLRNKGQVVSVFITEKKDGNIASQNALKDKIMDFQFSFKMPKNKDYKFSYTFKF